MAIHWWNTRKLVVRLAEDRVSEQDAVSYAMISAVLYILPLYSAIWYGGQRSSMLAFELFAVTAISLIGLNACFRANGGTQGVDFLKRISVISAPIGLKILLFSFLLGQVSYYGFSYADTSDSLGDPAFLYRLYSFGITVVFVAFYYWRIKGHLSRLVTLKRSLPTDKEREGTDSSLPGEVTTMAQRGAAAEPLPLPTPRFLRAVKVTRAVAVAINVVLILLPVFYLFSPSASINLAYVVMASCCIALATISILSLVSRMHDRFFVAALLVNSFVIFLFFVYLPVLSAISLVLLIPALLNLIAVLLSHSARPRAD
jgi:hypothetical protein